MEQKKGKATVAFARPPVICGAASIVGKKESEGPLGPFLTVISWMMERDGKLGAGRELHAEGGCRSVHYKSRTETG